MKFKIHLLHIRDKKISERVMAFRRAISQLKGLIIPVVAYLVVALPMVELKADDHLKPQSDSQIENSVKRGQKLSEKLCKRCHAIGVSDEAPRPNIPLFRKLAEKGPIDNLAEAFAEGIVTGHNDMPEFQFDTDEINDLLNYIDSVQVK